ncbi:cytochrome P450 [Allokutzneria oryzae]|uniref:Cytochrome P450 n=1 Tax=Allokutzneria oryzae TaxID=1378989 RepID=A0ABV5ZYJ4_9PSEU
MTETPLVPIIEMPFPPPGTMGPPEEYVRLRRSCPMAKLAMDADMSDVTIWYVTRYADVRALIGDPRLVRPSITEWPVREGEHADSGPGLVTMMEMDGAQHRALRRVLAEAFSARSVRRYQPRMRELAAGLLDDFAKDGQPGELISGFAEPFPLLVVCDLVGIPYAEREYFLPIADTALGALSSIGTLEEAREVNRQLREYVTSLIARKRREPADDVLTHVVSACDRGELTQDSVIAFLLSMVVAGYRTTTMFLANSVLTLLSEPSQYIALRDDRALMPSAVEELVRYIPVMNGVVVLLATEDISLHGQTIRAGDAVLPVLAAANRDETVFADPDQLDLRRSPNPHLVFGRGEHNCFGSHLARAELTTALEALLDRFPYLRLAEGQDPTWDDESPSKSPLTMPVSW